MPCADGPPVTSQIFEDHGIVTVSYAATKDGAPPALPKPPANAKVLSYEIALPLPKPIQNASGSGWRYSASGSFSMLEDRMSDPSTGMDYGRFPFRTIQTELAEESGFTGPINPPVINAELVTTPFYPVNLSDPDFYWPQALCITTGFFSANI